LGEVPSRSKDDRSPSEDKVELNEDKDEDVSAVSEPTASSLIGLDTRKRVTETKTDVSSAMERGASLDEPRPSLTGQIEQSGIGHDQDGCEDRFSPTLTEVTETLTTASPSEEGRVEVGDAEKKPKKKNNKKKNKRK
jgi:hypothetical protein